MLFINRFEFVKSFPIKGIRVRMLSGEYHGEFSGIAKCDYHPEDNFSIAVIHDNGTLLGYLPKRSIDIHKIIIKKFGGQVYIKGELDLSDESDLSGEVHIPLECTEKEVQLFKRYKSVEKFNIALRANKPLSSYLPKSFLHVLFVWVLNFVVFGVLIFWAEKCLP